MLLLALSAALTESALAQDAFTFVVVGDTQTDSSGSINWSVLPQIVDDMNTHDPAVGLFAGDLVGGAYTVGQTQAQWEDFKSAAADFSGELLAVPGNHDVYGGAGTFAAFAETFDWLPQDDSPPGEAGVSYYFDYGNTRFISITSDQEVSNPYAVSAAGQVWLERVLSESDGFEHVFVMTHHPVSFSTEGGMGGTSGAFWQALVGYGVDGMFSGHWHRYQPSQLGAGGDTWETIIGTGGGWQPFAPIREYQQMFGFLVVQVDGASAEATFYADSDGDGSYDDAMDSYTLAWDGQAPSGLIARYTFDEGAVVDSAPAPLGRGIDGVLGGDARLIPDGALGSDGALALDGDYDYAEAGAIDDYVLSINGDLTLSLWARADSLRDNSWGHAMICYGTNDYYTEDEETNYSYWLSLLADGTLLAFWEYGDGSNVTLASTEPVPGATDTWRHYALVRSADDRTVRFYVDGEPLGDPVAFDRLPTSGGRGMLYFGSDTVDYLGSYELDGALDEVCIYDQTLDPDTLAALAGGADCAEVIDSGGDTGEAWPDDTGDTGADDTGSGDDTGGASPGGDDTGEPTDGGCGCASAGGGAGLVWLVGLVGLIRRR